MALGRSGRYRRKQFVFYPAGLLDADYRGKCSAFSRGVGILDNGQCFSDRGKHKLATINDREFSQAASSLNEYDLVVVSRWRIGNLAEWRQISD